MKRFFYDTQTNDTQKPSNRDMVRSNSGGNRQHRKKYAQFFV